MIALYDEKQAAVKEAYGMSMPWDLGVLNGAGWRLFNQKDYQAAIQCWELLGREYPHYAEAFYFQAYGLKEMGKAEGVKELIQKAREALKDSNLYTEEEREELIGDLDSFEQGG